MNWLLAPTTFEVHFLTKKARFLLWLSQWTYASLRTAAFPHTHQMFKGWALYQTTPGKWTFLQLSHQVLVITDCSTQMTRSKPQLGRVHSTTTSLSPCGRCDSDATVMLDKSLGALVWKSACPWRKTKSILFRAGSFQAKPESAQYLPPNKILKIWV